MFGKKKNLIETGVIKKFATIVDEKKLGMEVLAFVFINLSPLIEKPYIP